MSFFAVSLMLRAFGIPPHTSCLSLGVRGRKAAMRGVQETSSSACTDGALDGTSPHPGGVRMDVTFEELRAEQNRSWAAQSVAKGVVHAHAGRNVEAVSSYKHAIELDPRHTDAYVARGAVFANTARYQAARAGWLTG